MMLDPRAHEKSGGCGGEPLAIFVPATVPTDRCQA